jgi:hypothetical protein
MTEGYGPGHGDDAGRRPSGRGAVTERLAAHDQGGAHEIDLTDEAAPEATDDQADREASGAFEPAEPTADTRPGSSNIFDVEERAKQEDQHPTGYEPPLADADADADVDPPEGASEEATDITPTPVPVAEPSADAPAPLGLPEPTAAADTPAAPGASASLLGSLDAADIRNRFLDIQAGFVDEPRQAVEEAGRFVDNLVRQVAEALQAQRGQLAVATAEGSTEDLRLALRAYRQFVDRLLGLAS